MALPSFFLFDVEIYRRWIWWQSILKSAELHTLVSSDILPLCSQVLLFILGVQQMRDFRTQLPRCNSQSAILSVSTAAVIIVVLAVTHVIATNGNSQESKTKRKSAAQSGSATDQMVLSLYSVRTADKAVLMIDEFLLANAKSLTTKEIDRLQSQRSKFVDLDRQKLVKLGTKWVTPAEREASLERSEMELLQAREDLKKLDGKSAIRRLEKASDLNPEGFEADFFLAMLFSVRGNFNPNIAQKHFERVLDRAGDFVPALNNLALTEVKLNNFELAHRYWRRAAAIDPRNVAIRHNLARVIHEADRNLLPVPKQRFPGSAAKNRYDLFVELATQLETPDDGTLSPLRPHTGWLYLPLALSEPSFGRPDERPRLNVPSDTAIVADRQVSAELLPVLTSTGTGFAVSSDHVLTNRHVIQSDDFGPAFEVKLQCLAGAAAPHFTGRVVAISASEDLALIHVPGLNAAPILASAEVPLRGTDIATFGYPRTSQLGTSLKMTRGIISSAPEPKLEGMFLLDAEANPGNSGGPVCDAYGRLAGVTTAVTRDHVGNYSLAIPAAVALNFVGLNNVEWKIAPGDVPKREWPQVDQAVSRSVFYLEVYHAAKPLQLAECLPEKIRPVRQELEDTSCSLCSGMGSIRCRAKGCALGAVTSQDWYTATFDLGNNKSFSVNRTQSRQERCDSCDGTGRLRCPGCGGSGISSDLR